MTQFFYAGVYNKYVNAQNLVYTLARLVLRNHYKHNERTNQPTNTPDENTSRTRYNWFTL